MLLGVISDTHDSISNTLRALAVLREHKVDAVVHCGDWKTVATAERVVDVMRGYSIPLYGVLGNNDLDVEGFVAIDSRYPDAEVCIKEGVLTIPMVPGVAAYHGHHAPTLRRLRENESVQILLLGHTHKPKIERFDDKLIVNPGSLAFAIPRSKSWKPTYALVDTVASTASLHEL